MVARRLPDLGPIAGLREQAAEAIALEAQIERLNRLYVAPNLGPLDRAKITKIHGDIATITAERRRLTVRQVAGLENIVDNLERCVAMAAEYGDVSDEWI
ncbi:MAG: hypothetical protein F2813_00340 [Actinobacteria bacterium]|nr:hypothetical protein [Actinomycetota bacterium]